MIAGMGAADVSVLGHLNADQIISPEQDVVVRVEDTFTADWLKFANRFLQESEDAPVEALRARGQRTAAGDLRIRDADAGATTRDHLRCDLNSICEGKVLFFKRHN